MHQNPVEDKPACPDHQVGDVEPYRSKIIFQNKRIGDLDRNHRCEHGTNEIQEIGNIVHGVHDGCDRTDHRNRDGCPFLLNCPGYYRAGYTGGKSVQKRGGNRGENDNEQPCSTQPRFDHNHRDIVCTGKKRRSHSDDIHEAADHTVDQCARKSCLKWLFRLSRIIAD